MAGVNEIDRGVHLRQGVLYGHFPLSSRLLLPQHSDVGDRTVDLCCAVYLLLKHSAQQVVHGLSNANAPSTTQAAPDIRIGRGQLRRAPKIGSKLAN